MKHILSFLFSLAAVIVCVYSFNANAVSASAATTSWCTVERLTVSDSAYTQAGDFKFTMHVQDNEGFLEFCANLYYNSDEFAVVTASGNRAYCTAGSLAISAGAKCSGVCWDNELGCWCNVIVNETNNITDDGTLFSIYFRRISGSSVLPVTDCEVNVLCIGEEDYGQLTVSEYCQMVNIFRIGDATLDGRIAIGDAQFILRIIANANGTPVTAANFMNYIPANFVIGDCVLSFEAMDVNEDGVLTSADATAIQNYLAGNAATGALLEYCTVYLDANAYTS